MELNILKEKEMRLVSRKRITLEIDNKGSTPSRQEILEEIGKKFNIPKDLIIIKHIYPQFGNRKTKVIVHIYQNKEKMNMFELKQLINKHKPKETKVETK